MAKARIAAGSDTSAVADEAAREERERIAKESKQTLLLAAQSPPLLPIKLQEESSK
jgi:hypothetical protein